MNVRAGGPQRIGFCITELEPGGAERCLVELVTRLDRQRFDPIVYCLAPRPAGNPTSLVDVLERQGVNVHCFDGRAAWQFPAVCRRLRRQLVKDAPLLLQTFLFHANVTGTIAAHRAGVPRVVTNIRVAERHASCHLRLSRWVDRWVNRHVCVSQSVREFSSGSGHLPPEKLVVIPNGVDTERFAKAAPAALANLGVKPGQRLMTFVGRLDPQKNVAWLVHQMPAIFSKHTEYDLVIVGDGAERAAIEREIASLGVRERIHLVGYRNDVAEILAVSDLYLHTSRWEGMPNAILEAMASGKAVVASNVEGVAELLGGDASPQTVSPLDAEAFVGQVLRLLADPQLRTQLGQRNQARVRESFSFEAMVARYQALYEALLA